MRSLEVAALALLLVAGAALVILLDRWRRRRGRGSKRPELPLSTPTTTKTTVEGRRHRLAVLILLFSGRRRHLRARVEPAAAGGDAPLSSDAVLEEDEVAAWRERWLGGPVVSRALYTIYEEREEEDEAARGAGDGLETDTETTFYTPPTSPPRAVGTTEPPRAPFPSNSSTQVRRPSCFSLCLVTD